MAKKSQISAPKKPASPYILYCNHQRSINQEIKRMQIKDQGKVLGEMWKDIKEEEKQKFVDMYQKEKEKYESEFEEFKKTPEYETYLAEKKTKKGKMRKERKPRKVTAYNIYVKEMTKESKGQMSLGERSKLLGEKWKTMGSEEKAKFERMAEEVNESREEKEESEA